MYKYFIYFRVSRVPKMKIHIRHEIYRVILFSCTFVFVYRKSKPISIFFVSFRFVLTCQIARPSCAVDFLGSLLSEEKTEYRFLV